jgi:hypothetical protein
MKKKIIAFILIAALAISLAATASASMAQPPVGELEGTAGATSGDGETFIISPDPENPDIPQDFLKLGIIDLWFSDLLKHMNMLTSQTNYKNRDRYTDVEVPVGAIITNNNTNRSYIRLGVHFGNFYSGGNEAALAGFKVHFTSSGYEVLNGGGGVTVKMGSTVPGVGLQGEDSFGQLMVIENISEPGIFGGSWNVTMDVVNSTVSPRKGYSAILTWKVMETLEKGD